MHTYRVQLCGSAHDLLAVGFFKHLLDGNSDGDRSLAAIVRTNPAAISIFLSFLNVDPMDALEDFMTRERAQYTDIAGCLAALEDIGCNSANRLSVITEVTGHTRLKYAIIFSPDSRRIASTAADGTVIVWDATNEWLQWDV